MPIFWVHFKSQRPWRVPTARCKRRLLGSRLQHVCGQQREVRHAWWEGVVCNRRVQQQSASTRAVHQARRVWILQGARLHHTVAEVGGQLQQARWARYMLDAGLHLQRRSQRRVLEAPCAVGDRVAFSTRVLSLATAVVCF